ncbi:MAG: TonB-dependent receptor [Flavobacteriales bacterium]
MASRYQLDVSVYYLDYKNRLGTIALNDSVNNLQIYRTNIGNSRSIGSEFYLNFTIYRRGNWDVQLFNSTAYNNSVYYDAAIKVGNVNEDVSGHKVESTPEWISRTGLNLTYRRISFNALFSYVSDSYADALNSIEPNASGSTGLVPEYALLDLGVKYKVSDSFLIQFNVNNVTDQSYFTKRPQFYPGPGIWPSDGRGFSLSIVSNFAERRYK